MKSPLAFLVSLSMIGVVFGGARTALMLHAHAPLVAMR